MDKDRERERLFRPAARAGRLAGPSPITITITTVGFHNFNLRIFNSRVSNPDKLTVEFFLTRCRISMCQGLGPQKHDEISEIDRITISMTMTMTMTITITITITITTAMNYWYYVYVCMHIYIYIYICIYIYMYREREMCFMYYHYHYCYYMCRTGIHNLYYIIYIYIYILYHILLSTLLLLYIISIILSLSLLLLYVTRRLAGPPPADLEPRRRSPVTVDISTCVYIYI